MHGSAARSAALPVPSDGMHAPRSLANWSASAGFERPLWPSVRTQVIGVSALMVPQADRLPASTTGARIVTSKRMAVALLSASSRRLVKAAGPRDHRAVRIGRDGKRLPVLIG